MEFRNRVWASFAIAIACSVVIAVIAIFAFTSVREGSDELVDHYGGNLLSAKTLLETTEQKVAANRTYILTGSTLSLGRMEKARDEFWATLGLLEADVSTDEAVRIAANIRSLAERHDRAIIEATERFVDHNEQFRSYYTDVLAPRREALTTEISKLITHKEELYDNARAAVVINNERMNTLLLLTILLALVTAVFVPIIAVPSLTRVHRNIERLYKLEHDSRKSVEASEKRFRGLAETLPQMVWATGPDGVSDYVNQQWVKITGLRRFDGDALMKAIHPDDALGFQRRWEEALETGEPFESEVRFCGADPCYRSYIARALPIRDDAGNITRWIGSAADIESQKEAIRIRDEFMAVASHELKTPLTALHLQLELLESRFQGPVADGDAGEQLAGLIRRSIQQSTRLNKLINQLLDLSRLIHGQIVWEKQPTDITTLVDSAVAQVQEQALAFGSEIRIHPHEKLTANWDSLRVEQVLVNLLSNALKYGNGKPIDVAISSDQHEVTIAVTDHGIGIDQKKHEVIFSRFERAGSPMRYGGLGLGLFIAHEIAVQHGGDLELVASSPGHGSTFELRLPLDADLDATS